MNPYDRHICTPLTLSDCGHAVCKECCTMLRINPRMDKCPSCRVKIRNDPQPNYILMDIIDEGIPDKYCTVTIGNIPDFVTVSTFKDNFLLRLDKSESFISLQFEEDKNSI